MFYQTEIVTPRITRIWDVSRTAMYLVRGEKAAVLIDTGVGVGSLKTVVRELTDKPVTVLLTHGHVDHAMGAGEFEKVYLNPADIPVYMGHSQMAVRQGYVSGAALSGADPAAIAGVRPEDYLSVKAPEEFLPLEPGSVFDLGGICVEVLSAPGHTPGSMAMLIPQEQILLLGDSCNAFTYLFDAFCPSVEQYRQNLLALQEQTRNRYSRTLYSHGLGEGCPEMIANVITVCDEVLAGNTDAVPFRGFNGEPACIARAMDFRRFCRADGGEGNLVYNPENIR